MYIFCSQTKRDRKASLPHFSSAVAHACAPSVGELVLERLPCATNCDGWGSAGASDLPVAASFAPAWAAAEALASRFALIDAVPVREAVLVPAEGSVFAPLSSAFVCGGGELVRSFRGNR